MLYRLLAISVIFTGLSYSAVPDGAVSNWKFDNDLTDAVGSNDGTMNGGDAVYEGGVNGQGIKLNSSALYVDVGNDASLDFTGSFSVGGWVLTTGSGGYQKIVDKTTWNSGFYIQQGSQWPGRWQFGFQKGGSVLDTTPVADLIDSWIHIMGVYDGSTLYLYRDGGVVASGTTAAMVQNTTALKFGKSNIVADEMFFYDRALTATEVADLMEATRDLTPPEVTGLTAEVLPGYRAMVTFTTDQAAYGTVEYTRDSVIAQYDHHDPGTEQSALINGLGVAETWYYRAHAVNLLGVETTTAWETLHVVMNAPDQKYGLFGTNSTRPFELDLVWPENVGDADVCLYPDDKIAAVTMTIDDNSALWGNHDWWLNWGAQLDQKYTWFVNTRGIDRGSAQAGTWDDFRRLYAAGHAVQSHSHTHGSTSMHTSGLLNWMEDYGQCRSWVEENIPGNFCLTNAYPGGAFTNQPDTAVMYFASNRGVSARPNRPGRFNYRDSNASSTHSQDHVLACLNRTTTVYGANSRRGWACFITHAVQTADSATVRGFLEFLHTHQESLWVGTYPDLIKYNQSFNTHDLHVTAVTDSMVSFVVTDSMLDTVYNMPLTVKVRISNDWDTCIAMQGADPVEVSVVEHNSGRFALVKAVPDRGEVVLSTDGQTSGMTQFANFKLQIANEQQPRLFSLSGRVLGDSPQRRAGVYLKVENGTVTKVMIME